MHLYLLRHGKAKSAQKDPQRPLNRKGRQQVQRLAQLLSPAQIIVDDIWHSEQTRAVETARIISTALKIRNNMQMHLGLNPGDSVEPIIREIGQRNQDLMIVGHLPFLAVLANQLLGMNQDQNVISFATATLLCLESVNETEFSLIWMLNPEMF